MDMLINSWWTSFHNAYVYQIMMLHTLNILQSCQLYLSWAKKQPPQISNVCGQIWPSGCSLPTAALASWILLWKKPVKKNSILYDFIYMKGPELADV